MAQPFGAPPPAGPASPAKRRQTEPAREPVELRAADVVAVKAWPSPRMAWEYPAWGAWDRSPASAADVHRRARGRYQRVEERGDMHRDPHAAMGGRTARHVGVPVDREDGADEEHRVVHLAERHRHPARHVRKGREVAGRRDGVAAAVRRAEVVPASGGDVADQRDMIAPVEDENL